MTALITPFANGTVDETRFKQQIERQIRGGISAIVAVGTTGESPTLTVEEHERVIELAVKFADGRIKVIAGTGANSTAEALELHRFAKQVGADACLSVDPYYNKPTQEGLYRHFMTLSDGVDLPIILYTIPGRTGITMSPSTAARLYKNGNFAAMKWATGQLDYASELMSLCDMPVLSGDDSQTLPLLSIGGVGVISVLSNLLPEKVSQLYGRFKQGDLMSAAQIHHEVFSLTRTLFLDGNPAGIKYAMKIVGLDTGEMRLPLVEVSDPTKKALETEVRKFF